jgi:hypothetical protein
MVVKNTTRILYKGCIFLRFEVQQHVSALYGHHQVLSIEVSLYNLREKGCDVEISHQIVVRICLCIGGYYATLIHIYIYCLSVGRGVSSWGCLAGCQPPHRQPHDSNPLEEREVDIQLTPPGWNPSTNGETIYIYIYIYIYMCVYQCSIIPAYT